MRKHFMIEHAQQQETNTHDSQLVIPSAPTTDLSFARDHFQLASRNAVSASIDTLREFYFRAKTLGAAQVKQEDESLVTVADRESGKVSLDILRAAFPAADLIGEDIDSSPSSSFQSPDLILVDPLDGTRPFVNRLPTSTVIAALYDQACKQVVACRIGLVSTAEQWFNTEQGCYIEVPNPGNHREVASVQECHVWDGKLDAQSTVYLDASAGSKCGERQILYDAQLRELFSLVGAQAHIHMAGSGGLHHAMVANGGEGVVGAVTTAMGGPWDVVGVQLALKAGGAARAFKLDHNRSLTEEHPLDVFAYDLLVVGNSQDTVDRLTGFLHKAVNGTAINSMPANSQQS